MNDLSLRLYVAVTSAIASSFASLKEDLRRESGQDLLEYALIGGFIAAAIITSFLVLNPALSGMLDKIKPCLDFDSATKCEIT